MAIPIRVLLVEDNPDDAELLIFALRGSGYEPQLELAENEGEFRAKLHGDIELIVADYSLPDFGAVRALRILKDEGVDIPLIVVTGTVTEQVVVECLKLGASDYLLKDRLTRIGAAVQHALDEHRLREEKRQADEALRQYANELEQRVAQRTAELQRAKDSVEIILNHTSDAIAMTDSGGFIRRVNPAFERMFGYRAEDILEQPLLSLADADDQPTLQEAIDTARQMEEPGSVELTARRRDGTSFVVDIGLTVMANQDTFAGVVCSIRDISERKRIEQGLRQSLEKERELSDLKSRFSSMVSHEFRTPLSVILSSSDLLLNYSERMSPERREAQLESIQQQVRRLANMLDDILALGKAQSVGLDLALTPIDVRDFCEGLVTELQPTAETHTFHFNAEGSCYDTQADVKLLRQAVTNLLSNAVKYSPEGSNIYARLYCENEHILIQIQDEGEGISAEDQEHLFEAFYRAKNVLAIPGSGLGLSIVKQAIEAHGGTVTCTSELGRGTTFTLTLPFVPGDSTR